MWKSVMHRLGACLLALSLCLPVASYATVVQEEPTALAMTGDAIFARPVLFTMTVVGSAVYVLSLPFSLLGNNAEEAAEVLVLGPASATFVRCLGCTDSGRKPNVVVAAE